MDQPVEERGEATVPVFGTWRSIYTAVVVVNLIAILFVYFFSRFPY
jgi:hypothetical protein